MDAGELTSGEPPDEPDGSFDPFADVSDETFRITTPAHLVDYLNRLAVRVKEHPDEIENLTSARLIEAAAAWADGVEGFFASRGVALADLNPWQFAAMLFSAGLIYE